MLLHPAPASPSFGILALVTSVGSGDALSTVLADLPGALPVPVLLGQHLGADHALEELLSCHPRWPVRRARTGTLLEAGHLYVGRLEVQPDLRSSVTPLSGEGVTDRSLDRLLTSLAGSHGPRVLAVVLAGEGCDGAIGARAILDAGGTVLVQDPQTAAPGHLPAAVIEAGAATRIVPLRDLGSLITALLNEKPSVLQSAVREQGSTVGWTFSRTIPHLGDAGETAEGLGAAVEVTARTKAEGSFARLFQASPAPVLVVKPDAPRFTITEVNDAYLAATMRTRDTVVGRGIFEAFPENPDSLTTSGVSALRSSLERVLTTHRQDMLPGLKYDIARPDGTFEERWWSPINSVVLGEHGEVEAIVHNANDITEQYRAEAAAWASQERFRTVANLIPDLIWESESDGNTTWYNGRWMEYTEQTFEQAVGWGWVDTIHPEDREASTRRYQEAVAAGRPLRQEHRIRRHDGDYRWFAVDAIPLTDERGQVTKVYGSATDIHALYTMNTVLEAQVEDRTRRLTDLNSELRTLATVSSQEINEPLRRLRGFLRLLERQIADQLDEKTRRYLHLIQVDAERAERLAENFKGLVYLEHRDLKLGLVPLTPLVLQVRSDLAPVLMGISVAWSVGVLPVVTGDALLLRQGFTELLHHSLKLVLAGHKAQVEMSATSAEGQLTVRVEVAPVAAEEADLQGDGLATARRVMQRHGGTLEAELQGERIQILIQLPDRRR